jgi:hypothetical protein
VPRSPTADSPAPGATAVTPFGACSRCGADLAGLDFDLLVYGDIASDGEFAGRFGRSE